MDKLELIPFKAEHLLVVECRDYQGMNTYEDMIMKEKHGPALTLTINGSIVGCVGILIWHGTGIAWAVFSQKVFTKPKWVVQTVRNLLRDSIRNFKLHRVEMVILRSSETNIRWAEYLGFTREKDAIARRYTPTKDDVLRYEFVDDRMINE